MKRTPLHDIQLEAGGIAATFGEWERIAIFGDPEMEAATAHESAIIMDSSSFGKFSITGKDAAKAIGRVIPKSVEDLKPGHVTHFVLLDENGCGIDDGVVSRRPTAPRSSPGPAATRCRRKGTCIDLPRSTRPP